MKPSLSSLLTGMLLGAGIIGLNSCAQTVYVYGQASTYTQEGYSPKAQKGQRASHILSVSHNTGGALWNDNDDHRHFAQVSYTYASRFHWTYFNANAGLGLGRYYIGSEDLDPETTSYRYGNIGFETGFYINFGGSPLEWRIFQVGLQLNAEGGRYSRKLQHLENQNDTAWQLIQVIGPGGIEAYFQFSTELQYAVTPELRLGVQAGTTGSVFLGAWYWTAFLEYEQFGIYTRFTEHMEGEDLRIVQPGRPAIGVYYRF